MGITDADIVRAATSLGVIGGDTHAAHRILAALCDPTLDARHVAEIIQREPGLAVRVLKVSNSAFYGSSRNIATPRPCPRHASMANEGTMAWPRPARTIPMRVPIRFIRGRSSCARPSRARCFSISA